MGDQPQEAAAALPEQDQQQPMTMTMTALPDQTPVSNDPLLSGPVLGSQQAQEDALMDYIRSQIE